MPRKLIFQAQPGASYKLYYGNPEARSPSYELERILPFLETENLPVGTLGLQRNNETFNVEETRLPFSERYTWLITVVVVVAAVAVAVLLLGVVPQGEKVIAASQLNSGSDRKYGTQVLDCNRTPDHPGRGF